MGKISQTQTGNIIRLIAALMFIPASLAGQSIKVTSIIEGGRRLGQGVTLPYRSRDCLLIVPSHVVDSATVAIELTGNGGAYRDVMGFRRLAVLGTDLTILRVQFDLPAPCVPWNSEGVSAALARPRRTYLRWRGEDAVVTLDVDIVSSDYSNIVIRPSDSTDELTKGMSGAQLVVNDVMAGMLLSIDGESRGTVLRSDRMAVLLADDVRRFPVASERWAIGDRAWSLGIVANAEYFKPPYGVERWSGGAEVGLAVRNNIDLVLQGAYTHLPNGRVGPIGGGSGNIYSAELASRVWVFPRSSIAPVYIRGGALASFYKVNVDEIEEQITWIGLLAGGGASLQIQPRTFLSAEFLQRHRWNIVHRHDREEFETQGEWSPIVRLGITRFWGP